MKHNASRMLRLTSRRCVLEFSENEEASINTCSWFESGNVCLESTAVYKAFSLNNISSVQTITTKSNLCWLIYIKKKLTLNDWDNSAFNFGHFGFESESNRIRMRLHFNFISISDSILICLERFFFLIFDLRFEALTYAIQIFKKTDSRFKTEIRFESCPDHWFIHGWMASSHRRLTV